MNVNSSRLRKRIRDSILILFLVVLVVAFDIGSSGFLRPSNIVSILSNFSVLLILSLGISWVVMAGGRHIYQTGAPRMGWGPRRPTPYRLGHAGPAHGDCG